MFNFIKDTSKLRPYLLVAIYTLAVCTYFLGKSYQIQDIFRFVLQTYTFYILLLGISKKLLNISIIITFIVVCLIYPIETVYGVIDFNFICSVYYTNITESISYAKIVPFKVIVSLFGLLIFSIYLIRTNLRNKKFNAITYTLLIIFLISFPLKKLLKSSKPNTKKYLKDYVYILPLRKISLVYLYKEIKEQDQELKKNITIPDSWNISEIPKTMIDNVVVVIGESVRKDFLHSYGFPINNTPFIDKSNHIQFNNYISSASHTATSLLRTLTLSKDLKNFEIKNSFISLANKVGYTSYWVSNQGKHGEFDSPTSSIAVRSHHNLFLKKGNTLLNNNSDFEMLPHFNKIIEKQSNTNKLIVLHMHGSHPYSCDRTNNKYDEFIKCKDFSCYSKSIKNLDLFLEKLYSKLKIVKKKFCLVYFSDHGLIVKNNHLTHGDQYKSAYDVPLLIWNDSLNNTTKINAQRSAKDFLHLFSQLLGVKSKNIPYKYNFISEEKHEDTEIKVFNNTKVTNYSALKKDTIINYIFKH